MEQLRLGRSLELDFSSLLLTKLNPRELDSVAYGVDCICRAGAERRLFTASHSAVPYLEHSIFIMQAQLSLPKLSQFSHCVSAGKLQSH